MFSGQEGFGLDEGDVFKDQAKAGTKFAAAETPKERVRRLHNAEGGPFFGWLRDEGLRRGMDLHAVAVEVSVTHGYLMQLRVGLRSTANISHEFARACANFLGVPTVAVLLASGFLSMCDFAFSGESEEELLNNAIRRVQDDPHVRSTIPVDLTELSPDAKKAVVMLYSETLGTDLLGLRRLPEMLRWLQRAAVEHDENCLDVAKGPY